MSSPPSNRPSGVSDRGTDLPLESEAGWSIQGGPGTAVDYPSGQGSDADPVRTGARTGGPRMVSDSKDLDDTEVQLKCAVDMNEDGVGRRRTSGYVSDDKA